MDGYLGFVDPCLFKHFLQSNPSRYWARCHNEGIHYPLVVKHGLKIANFFQIQLSTVEFLADKPQLIVNLHLSMIFHMFSRIFHIFSMIFHIFPMVFHDLKPHFVRRKNRSSGSPGSKSALALGAAKGCCS